ncbi:THI80 [Candida pseudojiufengensis]|uniref:THI80 n=1 Tax=Candida pseudojiufengensis TaxID=497109 RepID=UPI0022252C73|nr:THI80 [Candida pseudojiufengensis]KAI5964094.1 THI80 [Candida pseudojiufengensis]
MSKETKLKEEVTERPDSIKVDPPSNSSLYHTIKPFSYLTSTTKQSVSKNVLLILNQKFTIDLNSIWNHCELVVCADGGANRLYNYFKDEQLRSKYIPNYIVGDFDSISEEVKDYYEKKGTKIIPQRTQYSTDFQKAVKCIQLHYLLKQENTNWPYVNDDCGLDEIWEKEYHAKSDIEIRVYVLSAIGGRFDQTVQSINQLYILHQNEPNLQIFFITESDIIFLLYKGTNYVSYPSRSVFFKPTNAIPTCGLLPLSDRSILLSTDGLKYDVKNWISNMTGNVSSSNRVSGEDGFIVICSDPIVINIEVDL